MEGKATFRCSPVVFLCLLWFSSEFAIGEMEQTVELEPGHGKQDCDSVEEVKGSDNLTHAGKHWDDRSALKEGILDVGYYLRRFKFRGRDPRHLRHGKSPKGKFFAAFPVPPLRTVHWEVKRHCEHSFSECVEYLRDRVNRMVLPRHLDSLTAAKRNGWSFGNDATAIRRADDECLRLLEKDEKTVGLFSGPLQKFRWLTSASYYMCSYAMKEIDHLKEFAEDCDNFASCINWDAGPNNGDFRGDNRRPFACALYSFCPDPCCPRRYARDPTACLGHGPCSSLRSSVGDTACRLPRMRNVDLESMASNRWNVSCDCGQTGMRWDSESGICSDVDECSESESPCNVPSETCRNLRGGYECLCSPMGYDRNADTQKCERDPLLEAVFHPATSRRQNATEPLSDTLFSKAVGGITSWMARSPRASSHLINRTNKYTKAGNEHR